VLAEILSEPVVSSRGRRDPRKVKRERSGYPARLPFEPLPRRIQSRGCLKIIK
jgi:hypothetical protein